MDFEAFQADENLNKAKMPVAWQEIKKLEAQLDQCRIKNKNFCSKLKEKVSQHGHSVRAEFVTARGEYEYLKLQVTQKTKLLNDLKEKVFADNSKRDQQLHDKLKLIEDREKMKLNEVKRRIEKRKWEHEKRLDDLNQTSELTQAAIDLERDEVETSLRKELVDINMKLWREANRNSDVQTAIDDLNAKKQQLQKQQPQTTNDSEMIRFFPLNKFDDMFEPTQSDWSYGNTLQNKSHTPFKHTSVPNWAEITPLASRNENLIRGPNSVDKQKSVQKYFPSSRGRLDQVVSGAADKTSLKSFNLISKESGYPYKDDNFRQTSASRDTESRTAIKQEKRIQEEVKKVSIAAEPKKLEERMEKIELSGTKKDGSTWKQQEQTRNLYPTSERIKKLNPTFENSIDQRKGATMQTKYLNSKSPIENPITLETKHLNPTSKTPSHLQTQTNSKQSSHVQQTKSPSYSTCETPNHQALGTKYSNPTSKTPSHQALQTQTNSKQSTHVQQTKHPSNPTCETPNHQALGTKHSNPTSTKPLHEVPRTKSPYATSEATFDNKIAQKPLSEDQRKLQDLKTKYAKTTSDPINPTSDPVFQMPQSVRGPTAYTGNSWKKYKSVSGAFRANKAPDKIESRYSPLVTVDVVKKVNEESDGHKKAKKRKLFDPNDLSYLDRMDMNLDASFDLGKVYKK